MNIAVPEGTPDFDIMINGVKADVSIAQRLYTTHVMLALTDFSDDLTDWLQSLKDSGYNLVWAYTDYYQENYVGRMQKLLDAAQEAGIPVMPGAHGANSGQKDINLMLATKNHPAIYRIDGKPVYAYYAWNYENYQHTLDLLTQNDLKRSDYILLINALYAYKLDWKVNYGRGTTENLLEDFKNKRKVSPWQAPDGNTYYYYKDSIVVPRYAGDPRNETGVEFMLDTFGIDGLVNFAVDKSLQNNLTENALITRVCKRKGKIAIAGVSSLYASVSFYDFGFQGPARMWQNIIDLPVSDRPAIVSDTTANDYAELSYMSPLHNPAQEGLAYIPSVGRGFTLGTNTRFVLTDHSGLQRFLRPWVDAYTSNLPAPIFDKDEMYACYWLHPVDAPVIPLIPDEVRELGPQFTQQYWSETVYGAEKHNILGIKTYLAPLIGKIRMAAHLKAPAMLKINNTLSALLPAGPAYFEIERGDFRGKPTFKIARNGKTIKSGQGAQPITNSCFPGGWNPLITRID